GKAAGPGFLNLRLAAAKIGLRLGDIAHLDQDSRNRTIGAEQVAFGPLLAGNIAKLTLIQLNGLVGIGEGIGEPAELRPGVAAIEIELGETFAGFLAGRVGSSLGLQLLNR